MAELNKRQDMFCREYLKDLNATQAATRAGYSKKTAKSQGQRLLTNVDIERRIAKLVDARGKRTDINADWVLKRLAEESEADLADLYDESGALKPVHQWPLIWRQGLVAGLEVQQQFAYIDGEKVPDGVITKAKLSDRVKRLELIGRHVGVQAFSDKILNTHKFPDGPPTIITIRGPDAD